ncbi:HEAT repeat domain-containing protein [candidate division KSB1 bacterium]
MKIDINTQCAINKVVEVGLKGERNVNELIGMLNNRNWIVRYKTIEVIERIKTLNAVKPLIELVKNENNPRVVVQGIYALGKLKDRLAVDKLIRMLKENNELYKSSIITALGRLGARRSLKYILKELKNPDPTFRVCAIEALDIMFNESNNSDLDRRTVIRVKNAVIELTNDEDFYVRLFAINFISNIRDENFSEGVDSVLFNIWFEGKEPKLSNLAEEKLEHRGYFSG